MVKGKMRTYLVVAFVAGFYAAGILGVPSASAADFCFPGSGAGQCDGAEGVAVDLETGRVYVADKRNNRINVFGSDGSFVMAFGWGVADGSTGALQVCTASCFKGIAGSGPGQFNRPVSVAVDNSVGSSSQHDIYVGTDSFRIQKFDPEGHLLELAPGIFSFGEQGKGLCQFSSREDRIAVGPGGEVHVADSARIGSSESEGFVSRIQRFSSSGGCEGETVLFEGAASLGALAVDSGANIYVGVEREGGVGRKYSPAGVLQCSIDPGVGVGALGVDSGGNVFAAQLEAGDLSGAYPVVAEYDSGCNPLKRFGYGEIEPQFSGLAVLHSPAGDVFGSEGSFGINYVALPDPGPVVAPPSVRANPVGNTKATLNGEVNPEGKASTYRFDYVDQPSFEAGGFANPATKSTLLSPVGAEAFNLKYVKAEIGCPNPALEAGEGKCLTPETQYRFRLVAINADGEDEVLGSFETKPSISVEATWSTAVGTDSARIHTAVNPLGIAATGYLEYVDDAEFQESGFVGARQVPAVGAGAEPIDFGAGEAGVERSASLFPLTPGTTYHYRAVVDDPVIEPLTGPERTFTTFAVGEDAQSCAGNAIFRTGASGALPDCRAYELVTPLQKGSADILALPGNLEGIPATLSQSATSGGKLTYGSYRSFGDARSAPYTSAYIAERDAAKGEWLSHGISPPKERLALGGLATINSEYKAFSPDLCQGWLRSGSEPPLASGAVAGYTNLYRRLDQGTGCAGAESYEALTRVKPPNLIPLNYPSLKLQDVSADGSQAIYVAPDKLSEDASPSDCKGAEENCELRLYHWDGATLRYVCVLPDGTPSAAACVAGTGGYQQGQNQGGTLTNAFAADGSGVFFTVYTGPAPEVGQIYLRLNPGQSQSAISGGACTEPAKACTVAVSKVGEELSGASASQYWTAAEDGSVAIFTTGQDLYEYDVATKATTLIAHGTNGVMGASEDASRVYFASEEVLSGANPQGRAPVAGERNLYLYERGVGFRFVATLTSADANSFYSAISPQPLTRTSRVAPDGLHAAFMSVGSPTGYDNADAQSGAADAEVYLYDAAASSGAGKLACVSCNPTGSRPAGRQLRNGSNYWAAAQLPIWATELFASKVLAADGSRVFFESTDVLSPRDTNGVQDVYQWEAVGAGSCDLTDLAYFPRNEGCINLISSGQDAKASEFVDASPSGDDVFFATLSSLVSQDYGLVDIYDARVGGGLPSPPPLPAHCEGEACQSPAPAPQAPTPSSSVFQGPGNLNEAAKKPRCRKGQVRKKGHCVKKKDKSKKRANKRRGAGR